jgi:hypothetical protein
MTMKFQFAHTIRKRFLLVLIGMALVHAAIATPLMVRCVLADGYTALELLGQDPHRQEHPAHSWGWQAGSSPSPLVYCAIHTDDCSDLTLDDSAVFRSENHRRLRASNENACIQSAFAVDDIAAFSFDSDRNPSTEYSPHSLTVTSLRI